MLDNDPPPSAADRASATPTPTSSSPTGTITDKLWLKSTTGAAISPRCALMNFSSSACRASFDANATLLTLCVSVAV